MKMNKVFVLLIGSIFLISDCGSKEEEVIKIGAILPLTEPVSYLGE